MTENRLFRAQTDGDEPRWLVWLLVADLFHFVVHFLTPAASRSVIPTPAASSGHGHIIQNLKNPLRSGPAFNVNSFTPNTARGFQ